MPAPTDDRAAPAAAEAVTAPPDPAPATAGAPEAPLILFDGVCNLCHATMRFVADRDSRKRFRFAYLQSETGRARLAAHGLAESGAAEAPLGSMVLIQDGRAWRKSDAALRIAQLLDGGWPLMYGFAVVPRPLRDAVYDFIGRRRYRWFGRKDVCAPPREDLRDRLLG